MPSTKAGASAARRAILVVAAALATLPLPAIADSECGGAGPDVRVVRVAVIGRRPPFDLATLKPDAASTLDGARRGSRKLWIAGTWRDAAVFSRLDLPAGAVIAGPAVLEQPDTTIYVDPGLSTRVDLLGNVILERT